MKIIGKTALEISDCIRALVQNGDLRPGESLPPVRELAEALDVNRNTVAAAYQQRHGGPATWMWGPTGGIRAHG